MTSFIKIKNNLISLLTTSIVLSHVLICPTFAEGISYKNQDRTIKLNSGTVNTTIPYNLRGSFDEADYFTSSAFEKPPVEPLPELNFQQLPSPSNYRKANYSPKASEPSNFVPSSNANNFFSPVEEANYTKTAETSESQKDIISESKDETLEPIYSAEVEKNDNNIDLEGFKISKIEVRGLRTVAPNIVLSGISAKEGVLFNNELLQVDLQRIYSTGYFTDNMSVEPTINSDKTVNLTFYVEENFLINDVILLGNTVISTEELNLYTNSLKGKPQNLKEINSAINNIKNTYHQKGYILASIESIEDDKDGNLNIKISEGVINKIEISGNENTKDYVIERNIMTQPGTVYNEEYLKKDLSRIFSTQIFEEVNREIKRNEGEKGCYDITVVVKEKSTNSVSFGGGVDTGLGAFGSISLKEDNFLGKAQKLSLSGIIGSGILLSDASIKNHMNYQAELNFFEPYFLNADNSLMAKIYFREMGSWNVPLAIEQRIGFRTGVEHKIKGSDYLKTSFSAGIEHIDLKEGDYNRISQLFARNNLDISQRAKQLTGGFFFHLTPGIKYSNLDNNEMPREGIIAQAQFNEALGLSDFNHTNGRLSGAVTKFIPVLKKSTISLTGKAGIKIHGDDMPEIMAYRLGGPYSIRGYRMNGVGAGDSFVMGSAELATPLPFVDRFKWDFIKNMRLSFFVDAGKVFDPISSNILYDRPLHAITAGVGLRLHIPGMGPISVDYGLPITNPGDYGAKHGYFTFGTGGLNGIYGY